MRPLEGQDPAVSKPERLRQPAFRLQSRWELVAALALTAIIVSLHFVRFLKAGGLWRDEAATAHLASAFSVQYVIHCAQFELFPALVPGLMHVYGWVAGHSDAAFRSFGLLTGISILGVLWWNMWTLSRGVPLASLAVLGFNSVFIQWGDSVRGYGLGSTFILLTAALLWRVLRRPEPRRMALTALAGMAAVQCLFNNSVLLLALCFAAAIILMRREQAQKAAFVLLLGVPAVLSLLPYLGPMRAVSGWDMLVRQPINFQFLGLKACEALSASGWWGIPVWLLAMGSGVAVALAGQSERVLALNREQRELLLFAACGLLLGLGGYFVMLKAVSYPTRPWYYVAPMALAAMMLDFIFYALRGQRPVRLAGVLLVLFAAATLVPAWQQVRVRQTNADLVAERLNRDTAKGDLVIVTPWYNGISFNRYYRGPAAWVTIPPIESHEFHRYDLVKAEMILPDQNRPVQPILQKIEATLKAGHRVWVAGRMGSTQPGEVPPTFRPAPEDQPRWNDEAYTGAWSAKVAGYLRASASQVKDIPIAAPGPVNPLENLSLRVFAE